MNKIRLHLLTGLCLLFSICSFYACDDDYFEDFDDYYPSYHENIPIEGQWVITNIEGKYSSYNLNEEWIFYPNGDFETRGYDNLNEFGRWRQTYDEVEVRFNQQNRELNIRIEKFNRARMIMKVYDNAYDIGYENKIKYRLYLEKINDPWAPFSSSSTNEQHKATDRK